MGSRKVAGLMLMDFQEHFVLTKEDYFLPVPMNNRIQFGLPEQENLMISQQELLMMILMLSQYQKLILYVGCKKQDFFVWVH